MPGPAEQEQAAAEDLALCLEVRQGDERAFEQLYRRHADWARATAIQAAGADDADDVVSETFASLLTTLRRGGGPVGGVRGYLRTVIRRQAARLRCDTDRVVPVEGLSLLLAEPTDADTDALRLRSPEDQAVAETDDATAVRALESLPARSRRLIELVDLRGLSYRETAADLGMSIGGCGRALYLARRELFDAWVAEHVLPVEDDTHPARLQLARHLTGNHGVREQHRVAAHLSGCADCRRRVDLVDLDQWQAPSRRAALVGWLALLPLWPRRGDRPARALSPWTWRTALTGLGTVGAFTALVLLTPATLGELDTPDTLAVSAPALAQQAAGAAAADPTVTVDWLPAATLAGAADGEQVSLPFRISATGDDPRTVTLTIAAAAGVEVVEPYAFCESAGSDLICTRLGPLDDGEQIEGQLALRVVDATRAELPTLSVRRG